jgi:hypothetical protein
MANDLQISTPSRNAAMDAVTALINVGGAGTIEIYDGAKPAGPGVAVGAQVKLVTLTFSVDAFADAVNGVANANAITAGVAIANGVASWFRIKSGGGTAIMDGTVGTSNSDLVLATTTISVGLSVPCSSFTLTHPS